MARVLIVDDNDNLRAVAVRILTQSGHAVVDARTGKDALRQLETTPCDVVVTDVFMPDMDGLELLRALRRKHPAIKVVVMTGDGGDRVAVSTPGNLGAARLMGAVSALLKPFTAAQLTAAVDSALA